MVNRYVPLKKVKQEDEGIEGPHNIHGEGSGLCETETLCGHVGSGYSSVWKETDKPVTCEGCLDVIRMASEAITSLRKV